jgi:sec-independent protein translocase protein TatA
MPQGFVWVVILVVALLLFGRRLPEVMGAMGRGVAEFKKGLREGDESPKTAQKPDDKKLPGGNSGSPPTG